MITSLLVLGYLVVGFLFVVICALIYGKKPKFMDRETLAIYRSYSENPFSIVIWPILISILVALVLIIALVWIWEKAKHLSGIILKK